MYRLIDVETGEVHGEYDTVELARNGIEFSGLFDWEIWNEFDDCVAWGLPK